MQLSKILNLKSQSVLSHPSLNTEPPYTNQTPYILLIPLSNWEFFATLEALGERLKL
jgi:hypothetical protein